MLTHGSASIYTGHTVSELYNLAAISYVAASFEEPVYAANALPPKFRSTSI